MNEGAKVEMTWRVAGLAESPVNFRGPWAESDVDTESK